MNELAVTRQQASTRFDPPAVPTNSAIGQALILTHPVTEINICTFSSVVDCGILQPMLIL